MDEHIKDILVSVLEEIKALRAEAEVASYYLELLAAVHYDLVEEDDEDEEEVEGEVSDAEAACG